MYDPYDYDDDWGNRHHYPCPCGCGELNDECYRPFMAPVEPVPYVEEYVDFGPPTCYIYNCTRDAEPGGSLCWKHEDM